jgi:hypothetical protein
LAAHLACEITDYLLNPAHPDGAAKARYFQAFGFAGAESELLVAALFDHPTRNEVAVEAPNEWGVKYVIRCQIQTPDQRNPCIRSVWIIEADGRPRFVTAYPA